MGPTIFIKMVRFSANREMRGGLERIRRFGSSSFTYLCYIQEVNINMYW